MSSPLISLIVPVWGDDQMVVKLVGSLPLAPDLAEWVVAAVHPSPALHDLNQRGLIRLIVCDKPSRGRQLNAGAEAARGTLLCFHHGDSELRPEHLVALARGALDETVIGGAFHRRFHPPRMLWREPVVRWLNTIGGPLFGDQSIFVRASVFQKLGGFAEIPLMEDVEFSRRLRRLGRVTLLDPPLWSPPRRQGTWATAFCNSALIGLFYVGVDPDRLHRWYYGQRSKRA